MKTIGFLISKKNGEERRALVPKDIHKIKAKDQVFVEIGYGESIGFSDGDYINRGIKVVSRKQVLDCDIIVDVKLGDADYLEELKEPKILVGWAHAIQKIDFTTSAIERKHTIYAWEEMYEEGRYIFYRNREIAGEAAIIHGIRYTRKTPYECSAAVIGNGQTAKGAIRVLNGLGVEIDIFGRKHENLFKKKMFDYDIIVNCVMWDTSRSDRLIYADDIKKMKNGTLIIDVSCDPNLEIETSEPTTIDNPIYVVDGVTHYAVDNTPSLFPITVSNIISEVFAPFVDVLVKSESNTILDEARVIESGQIVDRRIAAFRSNKLTERSNKREK